MSEDTKQALDNAVKDHFKDEMNGAFMTDYILTAAGPSADDGEVTEYLHSCTESPFHNLYGLAHMSLDHFSGPEDEDG